MDVGSGHGWEIGNWSGLSTGGFSAIVHCALACTIVTYQHRHLPPHSLPGTKKVLELPMRHKCSYISACGCGCRPTQKYKLISSPPLIFLLQLT